MNNQIEAKFVLSIDGVQTREWLGEEPSAMVEFYSEIRKLDCQYRLAELRMKPPGEAKEFVRAVAHSDGRRI